MVWKAIELVKLSKELSLNGSGTSYTQEIVSKYYKS